MKKFLVIIVLLALGAFVEADVAGAQGTSSGGSTTQPGTSRGGTTVEKRIDRMFYTRASSGGQFEVQLGQLAQQNGQSQEVKDLGKMLVDDHTKANQQLMAIAQNKSVQLSTQPSPQEQKRLERFRTMTGADFDRAFVEQVVKDHREDIREYERESRSGADADAKAFAAAQLPSLRSHLQHAEGVLKSLPKGSTGILHRHHGGGAPGSTQGGTGGSAGESSPGGTTTR